MSQWSPLPSLPLSVLFWEEHGRYVMVAWRQAAVAVAGRVGGDASAGKAAKGEAVRGKRHTEAVGNDRQAARKPVCSSFFSCHMIHRQAVM